MKKVLCIVLMSGVAVMTGALVCFRYEHTGKPEYVQAAERRVGSYLGNDYGPVTCNSIRENDGEWELECLKLTDHMAFKYSVLPAEKAPCPVARSFYLEERNENARQSANQGLMRYLQIGGRPALTAIQKQG